MDCIVKGILKSGSLIQGELDAVLASLSDFPNLPGKKWCMVWVGRLLMTPVGVGPAEQYAPAAGFF